LDEKFGDKVSVTIEPTPNTSGVLEVTLVDTQTLLHSKKGGEGYVDTDEKLAKIVAGIEAYLSS